MLLIFYVLIVLGCFFPTITNWNCFHSWWVSFKTLGWYCSLNLGMILWSNSIKCQMAKSKILLGYFEKDFLEFPLGTLHTRQTHSKKYQNTGEKSFQHNIHIFFAKNKRGNSFLIIVSHHSISHNFCKNKCGNSFFSYNPL